MSEHKEMTSEELIAEANGLAEYLRAFSSGPLCRAADTMDLLCAEIERLEKENGALRSGLKRFCECPGSYHTKCKACEIAADALRGEGGKG